MKKLFIKIVIIIQIQNIAICQTQEQFNIGIWSSNFNYYPDSDCSLPSNVLIDAEGHKTSSLNQCREDGFNAYMENPNEWMSRSEVLKRLKLAILNQMKISINSDDYFRPVAGNLSAWNNVYDNCGNSIPVCNAPGISNYFRPHYNNYIDFIYSDASIKDEIWCHLMEGEASVFHWYHTAQNCVGWQYANPNYFSYVELPPGSVNDAISHFKARLLSKNVSNQKFGIAEANHGKSLNACTIDNEGITFRPQDYFDLLSPDNVSFEASYYQFPEGDGWKTQNYSDLTNCGPDNNWHYLANFYNIDYQKTFVDNVQDMISTEGSLSEGFHPQYIRHFHSNPNSLPNGNWLWFQAYTSIIHGVKGLWFFDLNLGWNDGEQTERAYFDNINNKDRFDNVNRFPKNYQNYLRHLARELRILVNIGVLTTDKRSTVAVKTIDEDPNCIVPPCIEYMASLELPIEKKTENYGLRYAIKTNGNKTYMIITNPLNVCVDVNLNFKNAPDQNIQNATGVTVLFNKGSFLACDSQYKVNRNSGINLITNTIDSTSNINFISDKILPLSFGPMDAMVLEFNTNNIANFNNGWNRVWTNHGDNYLGDFELSSNYKLITGDFNNNSSEDILAIDFVNNKAKLIDFNSTQTNQIGITTIWSQSNSTIASIGPWLINVGDKFYKAKFNQTVGLFCVQSEIIGSNAMYLIYNTSINDWECVWSNFNPSTSCNVHDIPGLIDGWSLKPDDKFVIGDFDYDGNDELLCIQNRSSNAWWTILDYNNNDFQWSSSNYGSGYFTTNNFPWPIRTIDEYFAGDFDGDGIRSDLFCIQKGGYNGAILTKNSVNWINTYNNYGMNGIGGWGNPTKTDDKVLIGDIDFTDTKEEILFIQNCINCGWATSEDLVGNQLVWNWSNHNLPLPIDFIDDWDVKNTSFSNSNYYLIKLLNNKPNFLMAIRNFGCKNSLINIYESIGQIDNKLRKNSGFENNASLSENNADMQIQHNVIDSRIIRVWTNSIEQVSNYIIFDLTGKIIQFENKINSNDLNINIYELPKGIYFCRVDSKNKNSILFKFIKL
ncbi:MAG: T9SS type A sorting domain-containing protein [Saprospiraceae bacterium]|nr:T9SS type A sorting domain-containing protein [Saprospiraceae bacterium]